MDSPLDPELSRTRFNELLDQRDKLILQADKDSLTGLYNRQGLDRRTRGRDWGWWIVCDLDGFKAAQDRPGLGHLYGDAILQEFATFLVENTRSGADRLPDVLPARVGGDEFRLWVETTEAVLRVVDLISNWSSHDGRVTCSVGAGESLRDADRKLYENKEKRRNQREQ